MTKRPTRKPPGATAAASPRTLAKSPAREEAAPALASADRPAWRYTNRRGDWYYPHVGTTKTGKRRYFVAKTVGEGALAALPAGWELVESMNAVVSLRRVDPTAPQVPDTDLARVRAELATHPHLRRHRADIVKGAIIVFQPIGGVSDDAARGWLASGLFAPAAIARLREQEDVHVRYEPVLRFAPSDGRYAVSRMTYRGEGGWSWVLDHGPLARMAAKYIKLIDTPRFFELT